MKSKTILPYALLALTVAAQSGCVAAWGDSKKVVRADEQGIEIQYDSALFSSAGAQLIAKRHCAQYGKTPNAVNVEMPGLLLGIISETYDCV